MTFHQRLCGALVAITALAQAAQAQDDAASGAAAPSALAIEFNSLNQLDGACRLTFLATNATGSDIDGVSLEAVLFTTQGAVERLTIFDLGALPQGRPRVRQFDVPGLSCDAVGQVLVNGLASCEGASLTPASCLKSLTLSSRTSAELLG
ncbi:hypothetical protein [Poseidonocella sedimentorum]|uniref:Tat pathway signal sequence domain protein n=1 Tax=Poseidonocella sedimentorum TaxID=871652 RepID=A0A1I6E4L7_9RHOB|nr:hypothetical protein [Poseidonocella sedimentorum]SFR12700.1 hypothetical protein SAMN04515673_107107 [Poseidonocella sedimentorum]